MDPFVNSLGYPVVTKKPHKRPKKHLEKPPIYKKKYQPKQPLPIQSPQAPNSSPVYYKCHKPGHIARYCKLNQRISTLDLDDQVKIQISNLLIDSEKEEDYLNHLEDDISTSSSSQPTSDKEEGGHTINVLTKDQNLLLDIIEDTPEIEKRQLYLDKFKESLNQATNSSNPLARDPRILKTYNLTEILDRFPSKPVKPLTLQNLQTEIDLIKEEIRSIKAK